MIRFRDETMLRRLIRAGSYGDYTTEYNATRLSCRVEYLLDEDAVLRTSLADATMSDRRVAAAVLMLMRK